MLSIEISVVFAFGLFSLKLLPIVIFVLQMLTTLFNSLYWVIPSTLIPFLYILKNCKFDALKGVEVIRMFFNKASEMSLFKIILLMLFSSIILFEVITSSNTYLSNVQAWFTSSVITGTAISVL